MRRRRNMWDVLVIGGGMAGLTAAWHAAQHGLATALLEKEIGFGGQVATVNQLSGWPSVENVSGYALASAVAEQARRQGVEFIQQSAASIVADHAGLAVHTTDGTQRTRRVVAASGARVRELGVLGEDAWHGKGVSHCADCDGPLYRDSDVVVVGAGDSAFQEALILATFCRSVSVVIRSTIRAKRAYIERATGTANIAFVWESVVDEIKGGDLVSGVVVRNVKTGALSEIACSGVFPFIGVSPNTDYLPTEVTRDAQGLVPVDEQFRTSVPSISAIGAIRSRYPGQLVNAAADGAAAVPPIVQELTGRL
jgi:thioredoxin reductase (NADPH)